MTTEVPDVPNGSAATGDPIGSGSSGGRRRAKRSRKPLPVWQESILLLAVALGLAVVIKALFVQAFYIPSESMEPGLIKNDRILVEKPSYWFGRSPQRGDVVVFEDPGGWLGATDERGPTGMANLLSKVGLYPTGGHLVKRVIGVEGDVVRCCTKKGQIVINGEPVDESSFLADDPGECDAERADLGFRRMCNWTIGPIPAHKVLVMGDNRSNSRDARAHMCRPNQDPCTDSPWVDTSRVVGKVFALVWPQDRWKWISRPEAFADVPDAEPAGDD
ncbi:signal peptidase I [Nocardioides sp. GY 10113]|uniref:signal peptidase I n=1 Tax=Nocardioides sp. GY 10113 TaxID=2569761 RepID=UPI0010A89F2E|nr:signal peptidase I [Nocardioides sp. GY 10113]TIC88139.1 signal peptidase I [Nocardioides sp. GY 10113]